MLTSTARAEGDATAWTWLVNAAVQGGREDIVCEIVAEAEDPNIYEFGESTQASW